MGKFYSVFLLLKKKITEPEEEKKNLNFRKNGSFLFYIPCLLVVYSSAWDFSDQRIICPSNTHTHARTHRYRKKWKIVYRRRQSIAVICMDDRKSSVAVRLLLATSCAESLTTTTRIDFDAGTIQNDLKLKMRASCAVLLDFSVEDAKPI